MAPALPRWFFDGVGIDPTSCYFRAVFGAWRHLLYVRTALGVLCAAALAGVFGACAALSGLDTYTSGDCPQACEGLAADAAIGTDAATVADAETTRGTGADVGSGEWDGATNGMDAQSDVPVSDAASGAETDAKSEAGREAGVDAGDGGDLGVGLVAFYQFDETGGTSAADSSGNNRTATLVGGATFSTGLQNNAVTLNGSNGYVSLPNGIVSGLMSFSICAWVNLSAGTAWSRIFDFGTGTTAYMFLTPNSGVGVRFSITIGGNGQEQQVKAPALATGSWQQVAVTLAANTGTLYVNGAQVAQNTSMTLNPANLGTTTQNWLSRSQCAGDPYLDGQIDNFRIYDRALTAAEVQTLYAGRL